MDSVCGATSTTLFSVQEILKGRAVGEAVMLLSALGVLFEGSDDTPRLVRDRLPLGHRRAVHYSQPPTNS